jgi:hypothetical protein
MASYFPLSRGEPSVASALQSVPFAQAIVARQRREGRISVQSGNYVRNDFADGCDLLSRPNTLQAEGGKTCQVLLDRIFKPMTPGRQLVFHGAGLMSTFNCMTLRRPATSELRVLLSFL